jgi:anaerobic magnesium-protoporphyrin IX monomethyl ester cyclase
MRPMDNAQIDALLIGYENQENLGLRSIIAYLVAHDYKAVLVPFSPGREAEILEKVHHCHPRIVGFSLIFQYALDEFGKLMAHLRAGGVNAHFTAGGHFPSLRPKETMELLPELDSIVRFEGELTLVELIDRLDQLEQWDNILGIAFRQGAEIVITPPRPLIADLDSLPPVYRDQPERAIGGIQTASILASRGCLFNCSFCSIRQFYGSAPGQLRRVRSPQAVVDEMRTLFNENHVRFFLFQDDDFAARTPRQREWLQEFLHILDTTEMAGQVRWKISCRVDDLDPLFLEIMIAHGLMGVYLGVESGSELGLRTLNKHVSVAQNREAIELLKRYDVALAIGFMLFDPSSTEATIRENIAFLHSVSSDGYFPINFCKMLPYAGTSIETQLQAEGRLRGTVQLPDYEFLGPQMNWFALMVQRIFTRRNFHPEGLVHLLQNADFQYHLVNSFKDQKQETRYGKELRQLMAQSNTLALETLEKLLDAMYSRGIGTLLEERETLLKLAEHEWHGEAEVEAGLKELEIQEFSTSVVSAFPGG